MKPGGLFRSAWVRGEGARAPPKKFIGSGEFAPTDGDAEAVEAGLRFGNNNSWIRHVFPAAGTEAFFLLLLANEFPSKAMHEFDPPPGDGTSIKKSAWDKLRGSHKTFRDAAVHHRLWDLGKSGEAHLRYAANACGTRREFRRTASTLLRHAVTSYDHLVQHFFAELTDDFTWSDYAKKSPRYKSRVLNAASQPRALTDVQRDECLRRDLHASLNSDGTAAVYGVPPPRYSCQYILDAEEAYPREQAIQDVVQFEKEVVSNPHSLVAYAYLRRRAVLQCPGGTAPPDVPLSDFAHVSPRGRLLVARAEKLAEHDHKVNSDIVNIPGSAGTGKTHLCDGFGALCVALRLAFQAVTHNATGTQEVRQCRTAHSFFAMSIDDPPTCSLRAQHKFAIRRLHFLWWDESSQYTRNEVRVPAQQAQLLRDESRRWFGGVVCIFSGDFTQLLGIVDTHETDDLQYERCLMSWPAFREAPTFTLNTPMRCPSKILFRFAQLMGEGVLNDARERTFLLPSTPIVECASRLAWRARLPEILANLYHGTGYFWRMHDTVIQTRKTPAGARIEPCAVSMACAAAGRLYLAPHNTTVATVNDAVMEKLPEPEFTFKSQTWPAQNMSGLREDAPPPTETDHLIEVSGGLPGVLCVRLGALLRLQSFHMGREGSLKGTLVVLTRVVDDHTLEVVPVKKFQRGLWVPREAVVLRDFVSVAAYQKFMHSGARRLRLEGAQSVPRVTLRIPRVRQNMTIKQPFGLDNGPHVVHYVRKAFPLKPAFAQTIDSAEGRTAERVVCDLLSETDHTKRAALWGHGRLKVAGTRAKAETSTTFILKPGQRTVPNPVNRRLYPRVSASARERALAELDTMCPGIAKRAHELLDYELAGPALA